MNLLDQLLAWLKGPATAPAASQPTVGDVLLGAAVEYFNGRKAEAQQKANASRAAAPSNTGPGATNNAAQAPVGQTLSDLLKAFNQ